MLKGDTSLRVAAAVAVIALSCGDVPTLERWYRVHLSAVQLPAPAVAVG